MGPACTVRALRTAGQVPGRVTAGFHRKCYEEMNSDGESVETRSFLLFGRVDKVVKEQGSSMQI